MMSGAPGPAFVVWDNRCSVHARTDFPHDERRLLRRLTVEDEHPVLEGDPPYREAATARGF